jgi:hypothetical protein
LSEQFRPALWRLRTLSVANVMARGETGFTSSAAGGSLKVDQDIRPGSERARLSYRVLSRPGLASNAALECALFSRDTGFDPLVRHLQALAHTCRRVSSLKDAFPAQKRAAQTDHYTRLLMLLKKGKARPIKPKSLAGKVRSWFPHLAEDELTNETLFILCFATLYLRTSRC